MQEEHGEREREYGDETDDSALPAEGAEESRADAFSTEGPGGEYPFWGWLDAALFAVVLVFFLVLTILVASVAHALGWAPMAPAAIVAQGVGMGAALLVLSRLLRYRYGVGLRTALHLDAPRRVMMYCGFGVATAVLVSLLGYVLKLSEMDMPMKDFIRTDLDLLVVGIGATTFGPLFEEMIFRGFLQPLMGRLLGMAPGVVATSLLFALPHGPQYGWHWQHLFVITAAGAVFGFIRWRTASTTAATVAHATYNLFLVIGAAVQRSEGFGS